LSRRESKNTSVPFGHDRHDRLKVTEDSGCRANRGDKKEMKKEMFDVKGQVVKDT
jgi:hypothetical protein